MLVEKSRNPINVKRAKLENFFISGMFIPLFFFNDNRIRLIKTTFHFYVA